MRKAIVLGGLLVTLVCVGLLFGGCAVIEDSKTYGVEPDYSKPWAPMACMSIAQQIAVAKFAKEVGGRKSLVMQRFEQALKGEDYGDQILGELDRAWERDTEPNAFLQDCMRAFDEHMQKLNRQES